MNNFSLKSLFLVAILMACAIGAIAQEPGSRDQEEADRFDVGRETYDEVLDLVFPRNALWGAGGYALVLRYKPTHEAESQITILNRGGE